MIESDLCADNKEQ